MPVSLRLFYRAFFSAEPKKETKEETHSEIYQAWDFCKERSRSVEVYYNNMDEVKILTRVHFQVDPVVSTVCVSLFFVSTCVCCACVFYMCVCCACVHVFISPQCVQHTVCATQCVQHKSLCCLQLALSYQTNLTGSVLFYRTLLVTIWWKG